MVIKYAIPQPPMLPTFKDLKVGDIFTLLPADGYLFIKIHPALTDPNSGGGLSKPLSQANALCFDDNNLTWIDVEEHVYMRKAEVTVLD